MKLSEHYSLLIEERKVRQYLLSREHPLGREKASFFGTLGFDSDNWVLFEDALRRIAADSSAYPVQHTVYGRKYVARGTLIGPTERTAVVNTVWIVAPAEKMARLVTTYPRGRQ